MKREDLFLAIGQVEDSRLLRSELTVQSASAEETEESKMKKKNPRRMIRSLLIAAVVVSMLAVTALAAVRGFGLKDLLAEWGMTNMDELDEITVTPSEALPIEENFPEEEAQYTCRTEYIGYTVEEAILDKNSIYVVFKISPLNTGYFIVPDVAFSEDIVTADGRTLEELMEEEQNIVYAGVRCQNNDGSVDGLGYTYKIAEDGNIYFYVMGKNTFPEKKFDLPCVAISHTGEMESIERVEFDLMLKDLSTESEEEIYIPEERVHEETGIQINSISVYETELAVYVTFRYVLPEYADASVFMRLVGADGEELSALPGIADGFAQSDDGKIYTQSRAYQKPLDVEKLQLAIKDIDTDISYGPFEIGKE